MDTRRLLFLTELARLGSMQRVAEELGVTTSTVSQQIAALGRDFRVPLIEPDGRRVRLTPAGRRLAEHATTILATVDAARRDLGPGDPAGEVTVAGFATGVRRALIPAIHRIGAEHPGIGLRVWEHEPAEALAALAAGTVDLALVYDYSLAPLTFEPALDVVRLWSARWSLGVPTALAAARPMPAAGAPAAAVLREFRDQRWIVNSRNTADADVVRILAAMGEFEPDIAHRADSLDLVADLITTGNGIGLLPADGDPGPGISLLPLHRPAALLRAFAVTRRGHTRWSPLAIVRDLLTRSPASS
ncbi:LysR family transcriptional regulator [Nakamurella sp.]|uniref:LysR family transcriptional regulator n=1 Tax=Nakamurella sp. TaxID=1869182 RepID=UPI003B3B7257